MTAKQDGLAMAKAALRDAREQLEAVFHSTPSDAGMKDPERYRLYRLCVCTECSGRGKVYPLSPRCTACRGEGRSLDLVATCGSPEAVGVALITLGREGEWQECPVGVLDSAGAKNQKWLVSPWLPSARNISDAGRLLRAQR